MKLRSALIGLVALGGAALTAGTASALPNGLPSANQVSNVDQVRWVCGPGGRCWWRPGYRSYGYYAPRRFYGPHFHRWHHRGWHRGWRHRW